MAGRFRGPVKAPAMQLDVVSLSGAADWEPWLGADESLRAASMKHPVLRAQFVVSRGLRRKVLAGLLGGDPAELEFVEVPGEKPRLRSNDGIDFNLSHAGDHVALVTGRGAVGVDLERIRPVRAMAAMAGRYFHPEEAAAWRAVSPAQREDAFFLFWSAREAAMKCVGTGLARGLALTRIDPAILVADRACGAVGGRKLVVSRADAPAGYVLVTAQADD